MRKEDILADCISDIQSGKRTLEECLSAHPQLRDELKSLVEIATSIQPEKSLPTPEFRQRARRRLFEAMAEDRARPAPHRGVLDWLKMPVPHGVFGLVVIITILFLTLAGGTTVYAYQYSLPGDALYPVKTGVETMQLTLTFEPEERFKLRSTLVQRRVDELVAQSNAGRAVNTAAIGQTVAIQLDAAIKEVSKVSAEKAQSLLGQLVQTTLRQQIAIGQVLERTSGDEQTALGQALDVTRRGTFIAQVAHGNPAFLAAAPSVLDEALEDIQLRLKGTLESIEGDSWNIGGLLVKNVNAPAVVPPSGSDVKIEAVVKNDTVFVSKVETKAKEAEKVEIQGVFQGTSSDGSVWIVSKVPVTRPDTTATPAQGSQVDIAGNTRSNTYTVTEAPAETDKKEVKISGALVQVDHPQESISVSVAGTNMQINISQAPIKSKDGQSMTLAELQPLTEKRGDVQAKGLYLKEGKLYAKEVRVEVEKGKSDKDEREKDKGDDEQKTQKVEKTEKDNKDEGKTDSGKKGNNGDNRGDDDDNDDDD